MTQTRFLPSHSRVSLERPLSSHRTYTKPYVSTELSHPPQREHNAIPVQHNVSIIKDDIDRSSSSLAKTRLLAGEWFENGSSVIIPIGFGGHRQEWPGCEPYYINMLYNTQYR